MKRLELLQAVKAALDAGTFYICVALDDIAYKFGPSQAVDQLRAEIKSELGRWYALDSWLDSEVKRRGLKIHAAHGNYWREMDRLALLVRKAWIDRLIEQEPKP